MLKEQGPSRAHIPFVSRRFKEVQIPWTEEPGGLHSPWGHKESGITEQQSTHAHRIAGTFKINGPGGAKNTLRGLSEKSASPNSQFQLKTALCPFQSLESLLGPGPHGYSGRTNVAPA